MAKSVRNRDYVLLRRLLRQVREEAGVTQEDLAATLGVPQSYVSKCESGERRVDLIDLRGILVALRFPLVDFVSLWESKIHR